MVRIITGATGLIGQRLTQHWRTQNIPLVLVGRDVKKLQRIFGTDVKARTWDDLDLDLFAQAEVVVNLAGANVAEKRWGTARKQEIFSSRINATKIIADYLAALGAQAPHLLNASAMGIYGVADHTLDVVAPPLSEDDLQMHANASPYFLREVSCAWEAAADSAVQAQVPVTFMRFAVVLASEGGALPQLVKPFKFYAGAVLGSGQQTMSWIAIDDVIRAIDFIVAKKATGKFNFSAPQCVTQKEFAKTIAVTLNKPLFFKITCLRAANFIG